MTNEERVWWEELQEWYEDMAYDPLAKGDFTCVLLNYDRRFGFYGRQTHYVTKCLEPLWKEEYGDTPFPIGPVWSLIGNDGSPRDTRRVEGFCHHMADQIEWMLEVCE